MSSTENTSMKRTSLNGVWRLDKNRGTPSMRGYLETMNVTELAIEAHEKGESDHDTIHTITLNDKRFKVVKRSRVNADLVVDLELGTELIEKLPPGDRIKKTLAISENPGHVQVKSSLNTMNGMAHVTDVKRLQQEGDKSVLVQELTIVNEQTGKTHVTTRYFNPYTQAPPYLAAGGGNTDAMQVG